MLHKITILGDGGVGKTAICRQFCLNQFIDSYDPTIEDSYRRQVIVDDITCMIEILDTAGQEEFLALRDQWIRDGHAFILAFSFVSKASFLNIEKLHQEIIRIKDNSASIILVGNKYDQILQITDDSDYVTKEEAIELSKRLNIPFVETSAKTGFNIEKAFFDIVRGIRVINGVENIKDLKVSKKENDRNCCCIIS